MARLLHHSVGPGALSPDVGIDEHASTSEPAAHHTDDMAIDGTRAIGGRTRALPQAQDMSVDGAIASKLEVNALDAVSAISLNAMQPHQEMVPRAALVSSLYGSNLAHGLLSFVTPHLTHPDMLSAGQRDVLLERLSKTLSAAPEDLVSRDGIAILNDELRRLILLRQNWNSLIKG